MNKEIIIKYKLEYIRTNIITHAEEVSSLIFDTMEELKHWLQMALMEETEVKISEVKGVIGTKSYRSGIFTEKSVKTWIPLKDE